MARLANFAGDILAYETAIDPIPCYADKARVSNANESEELCLQSFHLQELIKSGYWLY